MSYQLEDLSVRIASLKMQDRSQEHVELLQSVMSVIAEHYVFGTELGISLDGLEGLVEKGTRRNLSKACTTLVDLGI